MFSCKENMSNTLVVKPIQSDSVLLVSNLSTGLEFCRDTLLHKKAKFSGVIFQLYQNGDTAANIQYLNGMQDGIVTKWYPNRQLMETRNFVNGKKNGMQIAYFENGNKKFEFKAVNDTYEGEMKEWNIDGKLIHLATYKNGQEEGIQKMWYDNGKIRANYVMKNGKRYGLLGTKNCTNVSDSIFNIK